MAANPVRLPTIRRLSAAEARDQYPSLWAQATLGFKAFDPVSSYASRVFQLPPGSVYVPRADVQTPFLFPATVAGRRTYVVVARERGDIEWPAWLAHVRETAPRAAAAFVRDQLADVAAWIEDSRERLFILSHDPKDLDDYTAARWYAAAANQQEEPARV